MSNAGASDFPKISTLGATGLLVTFGDDLASGANHAALAFRAAIDAEGWTDVEETAVSLVSVGVRFDPLRISHADMRARIEAVLSRRDWFETEVTGGRLWTVPAAFGGSYGPQLHDAAALAGVSAEQAIVEFCAEPVRVLTIGFAPSQPYMGHLPKHWDIPRQTELTPRVPMGAIVVAIRQLIIFSRDAPTGWRQVGQCGFQLFRPEADAPFALRAGDQLRFRPVSEAEMDALLAENVDGLGGAICEDLS